MADQRYSRRRLLAASGGVVSAAAIAGCTSAPTAEDGDETVDDLDEQAGDADDATDEGAEEPDDHDDDDNDDDGSEDDDQEFVDMTGEATVRVIPARARTMREASSSIRRLLGSMPAPHSSGRTPTACSTPSRRLTISTTEAVGATSSTRQSAARARRSSGLPKRRANSPTTARRTPDSCLAPSRSSDCSTNPNENRVLCEFFGHSRENREQTIELKKHIKPAKVVYNGSVYKGGSYIR